MKGPTLSGARRGLSTALRNFSRDTPPDALITAAINNMHTSIFSAWMKMPHDARVEWDQKAKPLVLTVANEFRDMLRRL